MLVQQCFSSALFRGKTVFVTGALPGERVTFRRREQLEEISQGSAFELLRVFEGSRIRLQ